MKLDVSNLALSRYIEVRRALVVTFVLLSACANAEPLLGPSLPIDVGGIPGGVSIVNGIGGADTTLNPNCGPHHMRAEALLAELAETEENWSSSTTEYEFYVNKHEPSIRIWLRFEETARTHVSGNPRQICVTTTEDLARGVDGLVTNCICTPPTFWTHGLLRRSLVSDAGMALLLGGPRAVTLLP